MYSSFFVHAFNLQLFISSLIFHFNFALSVLLIISFNIGNKTKALDFVLLHFVLFPTIVPSLVAHGLHSVLISSFPAQSF